MVIGDLSDQRVVERLVERAVERSGTVNVLVNNAGIMDRMSALGETEWDRVMRVNVTAPFRLTRAVLPSMISAGGGAIAFTASEAGLRGSAARCRLHRFQARGNRPGQEPRRHVPGRGDQD